MAALNRPILSLWPELWRALVAAPSLSLFVALALFPNPSGSFLVGVFVLRCLLLLTVATVAVLIYKRSLRLLWRLARRVRRFHTVADGQIVLHFAPELEGKWNLPVFLERCRAELDRLGDQFGSPLQGRVVVYLFAHCQDIVATFGYPVGGAALLRANAILVAGNDFYIRESLAHEFAHLFSARWSILAPPLLSEGLSMWWQGSYGGRPIDSVARPLLKGRCPGLRQLLSRQFFFSKSQRHCCYVLAGSFTGFLIRRYGWQPYRKLFRLCDGWPFRAKFKKCFGVSLEKAESAWRTEFAVMEILNRRLGRNVRF